MDELEKKHGVPPTPKLDQAFSMRAEEQRQQARGTKRKSKRKGRGGRFRTKDKIALAERSEPVFPKGIPAAACHLSHVRPVGRFVHRPPPRLSPPPITSPPPPLHHPHPPRAPLT